MAEKYKNISVDADLVEKLNMKADELEHEFGFRPTLSQTLRHILRGPKEPKINPPHAWNSCTRG